MFRGQQINICASKWLCLLSYPSQQWPAVITVSRATIDPPHIREPPTPRVIIAWWDICKLYIFWLIERSGINQILRIGAREKRKKTFTQGTTFSFKILVEQNLVWELSRFSVSATDDPSSTLDNHDSDIKSLGTGEATKTDEFSEKFQTAFDPLPPLIFGKLDCNFCLGKHPKKTYIKV